jgi:uncharacterized repeat protein (TIGR03803 family)
VTLATTNGSAQTLTTLYSFTGGSDGATPFAGLISDPSGNLYGTTQIDGDAGAGTVFELVNSSGNYTVKVLYSFTGGSDGGYPFAGGLISDSSGNLYGTTQGGGAAGNGTVFELVNSSGNYTEKVLYSFTGGSDGGGPLGGLIADSSGNLYGTTAAGNGTVFELVNSSGNYTEKVLYSFTGGSDGRQPFAGLIFDSSGNLYGTTLFGGAAGNGTVFELVNSSGNYTEKVLYSFTNGSDGGQPAAGLIFDSSGNLYGTTGSGGAAGAGTVFELVNSSGNYTERVLYSFGGSDGANPVAGLIADASGNLYGTTALGGAAGAGTVFELVNSSGNYTEKVLYSFTSFTSDGSEPEDGLIADSSGNLYGTTVLGGFGAGTVFKISGGGFVPPVHFAGVPGAPNCTGVSVSSLAHTYGGLGAAAKALGYTSVSALQNAISAYCRN